MLDECGVPLLLVGDSLGMVVLGLPDTTGVTMADMEHHTRAVARAKPNAMVVTDLPKGSYENAGMALVNARRLMDAGAEAVKAEGGTTIRSQVEAIVTDGIPFFGHIGMLPQNVHAEGGYRVKGKTNEECEAILCDADALAEAGAFGVVLVLVASAVAAEITRAIPIPTIGIGAGPKCDGQIQVYHDILGLYGDMVPKHTKQYGKLGIEIQNKLAEYKNEVEVRKFPSQKHFTTSKVQPVETH